MKWRPILLALERVRMRRSGEAQARSGRIAFMTGHDGGFAGWLRRPETLVGLSALLLTSLDSELYRLPVVIEASTFGGAALTILLGSAAAGLWVRRHLDRLDLVAVLKTRE